MSGFRFADAVQRKRKARGGAPLVRDRSER